MYNKYKNINYKLNKIINLSEKISHRVDNEIELDANIDEFINNSLDELNEAYTYLENKYKDLSLNDDEFNKK